MTRLLLHGIIRANAAPAALATAQHLRISAGGLTGLATRFPQCSSSSAQPSQLAQVEAHHALLSAYSTSGDVLPVRFGSLFSCKEVIASMLDADASLHFARLDRISDCVEFSLKLGSTARPFPQTVDAERNGPEDGRAFLKRKRSKRDAQRDQATRRTRFVSNALQRVAKTVRGTCELASSESAAIAAYALLVPRDAVPHLLSNLRRLSDDAVDHGVEFTLRGPSPCYTFADDDPRRASPTAEARTHSQTDHEDA